MRLNSRERYRDALTHADAHGSDCALCIALLELQRRSACDPGAGHAERMTERNRGSALYTY